MRKILAMTALLAINLPAIAEWKGVGTDRDGVFWFLETSSGKLLMVEHVYVGDTVITECADLEPNSLDRYDLVRGGGQWAEVIVTDKAGGRFMACTWQGDVSISGNGPNTCRCGYRVDLKPTPKGAPPPPTVLE